MNKPSRQRDRPWNEKPLKAGGHEIFHLDICPSRKKLLLQVHDLKE
jgi:hypothetical protein